MTNEYREVMAAECIITIVSADIRDLYYKDTQVTHSHLTEKGKVQYSKAERGPA